MVNQLSENESDPYLLWAEIIRLREELKGPDQYATWRDAAVSERIKRVAAERALAEVDKRKFKEEPSAFRLDWPAEYSIGMDRYYTNNDSPRMGRAIQFAPAEHKPKVVPLYEMIEMGEEDVK